MRPTTVMPSQKAEKLPATTPERMLRLAPPWREERTVSRTCWEAVEVKTLTSSGMRAPASVPQVMMVARRSHRPAPRPLRTSQVAA